MGKVTVTWIPDGASNSISLVEPSNRQGTEAAVKIALGLAAFPVTQDGSVLHEGQTGVGIRVIGIGFQVGHRFP